MIDIFSKFEAKDWITIAVSVGALAGTIFSNFNAWRALGKTGELKAAEFKKERVENLRVHFAAFVAATYSRANARKRIDTFAKRNIQLAREWREKYAQFTAEVERHKSYIKLCLDEGVTEHQVLIKKMEIYADEKHNSANIDPEIHSLARAVIKKEWERSEVQL